MEPVTHLLTGACLARTGFHRRVAYATGAMAVAAEFPDIDTIWSLRGPVSGFEHHRGITHTFLGVPFEAGILLLAGFAWHAARQRRRASQTLQPAGKTGPRSRFGDVPVRWGALYGLLVLALLSHLLLDYTNNYGLRPFFPFNDRWYAASIVFIFDPLMFVLLLAGLLLPLLFRLVGREIGAKDQSMAGSGWARAALMGVLLLWGVRTFEHSRAIALADRTTLRAPESSAAVDAPPPEADIGTAEVQGKGSEALGAAEPARPLLQPLRALASPDPLSIFRWYTATDFGPADQLGVADSRVETLVPGRLLVKPAPTPALAAAERSELGRVYLDWSPMPFLSVGESVGDGTGGSMGDSGGPLADEGTRTVFFEDPRFMGDMPFLHRSGPPPLTGEVLLDSKGRVAAEGMDGRFGR